MSRGKRIRVPFVMKSTSIHSLNTDQSVNRLQCGLWIVMNGLNNTLFPNLHDPSLTIRDFKADTSEGAWGQTNLKSSPSRKLSDLFWIQAPWDKIQSELGEIHAFDTGCGSGHYGEYLQKVSKRRMNCYTGIDIVVNPAWKKLEENNTNFKFFKSDHANFYDSIPNKTNLFISQSAIEHFEYDLLYFDQIRRFSEKSSEPTIQMHLFPSPACLKLYRLHGVRQYTARTVSKITRLFRDFSYCVLVRLGGRACNRLHWDFIVNPSRVKEGEDSRDKLTQEYNSRLLRAVEEDNRSGHHEPSFYALIIHSKWKNKLFEMWPEKTSM